MSNWPSDFNRARATLIDQLQSADMSSVDDVAKLRMACQRFDITLFGGFRHFQDEEDGRVGRCLNTAEARTTGASLLASLGLKKRVEVKL